MGKLYKKLNEAHKHPLNSLKLAGIQEKKKTLHFNHNSHFTSHPFCCLIPQIYVQLCNQMNY